MNDTGTVPAELHLTRLSGLGNFDQIKRKEAAPARSENTLQKWGSWGST